MSNEWMIDVLRDLRQFAFRNGLMALAEQLDDTIHIAAGQIAARDPNRGGPALAGDDGYAPESGIAFRAHAGGTRH